MYYFSQPYVDGNNLLKHHYSDDACQDLQYSDYVGLNGQGPGVCSSGLSFSFASSAPAVTDLNSWIK
jgi:hypothetical protein